MASSQLMDPDDPYPLFLSHIRSDPARAMAGLWEFLCRLCAAAPPRMLRWFPAAERQDEIAELFAALTRDDFAKLRAYEPAGYPFAVWLYTVADRHLVSRLRRRRIRLAQPLGDLPESMLPADPEFAPGEALDRRRVAATIRSAVSGLQTLCRLLLRARYSDDRKPAEIVRLLGWADDANIRVSEMIRNCRGALRTKLVALGVDRDALRMFD